jgi:hypothetical protein
MISLENRISILKEQHIDLDKRLHIAEKNYESDEAVAVIKKQKLKIKDEITRLEKQCMQ